MKHKILNVLLVLTSLLGYLEWGGGNSMFLFQAEAQILSKIFTDPQSVLHPLTVLPMVGQLLLVITLFQKDPNKRLTYIAIGGLGLLLGFMFIIGWMSLNYKVIGSAVPFLVVAVWTIANRNHGGIPH